MMAELARPLHLIAPELIRFSLFLSLYWVVLQWIMTRCGIMELFSEIFVFPPQILICSSFDAQCPLG